MDYIRAENLDSFQNGVALLQGVSLGLRPAQRVGLVGRNGAGKTHLLHILAREHEPKAGRVSYSPGLRVRYLRQARSVLTGSVWDVAQLSLERVIELEASLRREELRLAEGGSLADYAELTGAFEAAGGYGASAELEKTLHGFGFGQEQFTQPAASLSGGERARLELVVALSARPDVLLLDEPTNHLDLPARRYLSARLAAFKGALLVVSHDRALLDAVCTHVARLEQGTLTLFKGNYSRFQAQQDRLSLSGRRRAAQAAKEKGRLEAARQRLSAWGTPKAQRQRRQIGKRLAHLDARVDTASPPEPGLRLTLQADEVKRPLLRAEHLAKTFGTLKVHAARLELGSGDKVALVGPNGAGKSTLLGLIAGTVASEDARSKWYWHDKAKLALFDQRTRGVGEDAPAIAQLTRFVSRPRAELLLSLIKLPPNRWHDLPTTLSGGERARLGLALLIAGEANVLLLDEPTNDLDIPMIETLESALADTDAGVVFATHDQSLVEAVATRVWSLEGGELVEYRGGLAGYLKGTRRQEPAGATVVAEPSPLPEEDLLEARLERLEQERLAVELQLLDPLTITEREYDRLLRRYDELWDELSLLYDAQLPAPLPRFEAAHGGVRVTTEGIEGGVALLEAGAFQVQLKSRGGVGHLRFVEGQACSLAWARRAALSGVVQLAFERLNLFALQLQTSDDLSALGFQAAGGAWWLLSLNTYERQLGYEPAD